MAANSTELYGSARIQSMLSPAEGALHWRPSIWSNKRGKCCLNRGRRLRPQVLNYGFGFRGFQCSYNGPWRATFETIVDVEIVAPRCTRGGLPEQINQSLAPLGLSVLYFRVRLEGFDGLLVGAPRLRLGASLGMAYRPPGSPKPRIGHPGAFYGPLPRCWEKWNNRSSMSSN